MDFGYSPHREAGGTLHLPSPTHPHSYRLDGLAAVKQLRKSLSRSPSKPQRFSFHPASPAISPTSSISPLGLSRSLSAREGTNTINNALSPPLGQPPLTAKKSKFSLRRSAPFRSSSRTTRSSSRSPMRRALSDSTNQGNAAPSLNCRGSGEENASSNSVDVPETSEIESKPPVMRLDIGEAPPKLELPNQKPECHDPLAKCLMPAKSSPLKRSDGIMDLDQAISGSPVAKRRSLHGAPFSADFDIFDNTPSSSSTQEKISDPDREMGNTPFSTPAAPKKTSPLRKALLLRKSTVQQRHGLGISRAKPVQDQTHDFVLSTRARQRMSLDSTLSLNTQDVQSPFRRSSFESSHPFSLDTQTQRPMTQRPPHPLSHALTPSSSASSMADDSPSHGAATGPLEKADRPRPPTAFSKSLPIGATRPTSSSIFGPDSSAQVLDNSNSFATPAFKMAKPLPAAFMSTGLISKRNRNVDIPPAGSFAMPDTPSKRVSFPPMTSTPFRDSPMKMHQPRHEFGTPTTPFSTHKSRPSLESLGHGVSIFGTRFGNHNRRASFASIDGDETSQSPSAQVDSQSSTDDLPPTPTKQGPSEGRPRSKGNSLRSSLFGRRTSLGPDTFTPPLAVEIPSPKQDVKTTPVHNRTAVDHLSPHTPKDSLTPPDPSGLSISAQGNRRCSFPFGNHDVFPPATPTGPRDHSFSFSTGHLGIKPMAGLTRNDVDTELTSRFGSATLYGNGEFSQVYRVENPIDTDLGQNSKKRLGPKHVWAVKKTKKPYAGMRDRQRKLNEVRVLSALRDHDHIIQFVDSWEAKNHLYIQTEFCENGTLKDFLTQAGFKARLDDFRIWKILLELSLGIKHIHDSGFIHLDLKPANVFIAFEGHLKIGDFGLASTWPAPADIEGEGDREYIGPEVLAGKFDKPADMFALGMIMLEIAGNIVLPDNGRIWQRLRAGDIRDIPSLTFSSDSSLARDESGEPISALLPNGSNETLCTSDGEDEFKFLRDVSPKSRRAAELVNPPNFMVDPDDSDALEKIVLWMISPQPEDRPVIDQAYHCGGVQWVARRRRSGATVFEGTWGPSDDVLNHQSNHDHDVDMVDVN